MTPHRSPTASTRKRSFEATHSAVLRLSRIALEFARTRDLSSALAAILNVVTDGYGCSKGFIYLHTADRAKPTIAAQTGIDVAEAESLCSQPDPARPVHLIPLVDESGEELGQIAVVMESAAPRGVQQASLEQICAEHAASIVKTARLAREPALSDSDWHLTALLEADLKLAQEALTRSQRAERSRSQELEALMHSVPAAIMIAHDPAGTLITGNSVAYRMLRAEPGENLSKSAPAGAAPTSFEVYQDGRPLAPEELPIQVVGRTGRPILNVEMEWRFPDGVSTWVYGGAIPLIDDEGAVRSVVGAFVDITELKLASQAVRESEERFRNMADCAPVMIRLMTPDARCAYANRLWCEFTGQDPLAASEHGWMNAVHPDDRAAALAGFSRAANSRVVFRLEYRLRRADGAWRWALSAGSPRLSQSGELLGFISSIIDISDRKEMEDTIRSANADLQQFAYAAAHDLQEPLRNVTIYSQLLADRYGARLEGEALQFLNFATHGARRMQILVDDLLAYTRLSSTETEPAPVDTAKVLSQVTEDLESAIQESGARIEIGAMPVVVGHASRLSQLFQNLISNAIKYRRPGIAPLLAIGAEKEAGGHWHVTVQDNGIGIEADYHEQVFGIFKRLHHSSVPGTGIGLAICRRIVEGHRGRIWVESDGPMKGTTVHFTLPA